MKNWTSIACAISLVLLLSSCGTPGNVRHDVRSLQNISPLYFDLTKTYPAGDYQIETWINKIFPGPVGLCKGRYIATVKDRSGTYFSPPKDCDVDNSLAGVETVGIWVPDAPEKDGHDIWFVIKTTKTNAGVLIDALNSLENGDYKRGSFTIVTRELLDEIQIKPLPPQ